MPSSTSEYKHSIVDGIDFDAAYATAIQAHSDPPEINISEEERKKNPFMLSRQGEKELEERKRKSEEEGRGGVVSPLEVEEVREKYVRVLGYMEKLQKGADSGGELRKG